MRAKIHLCRLLSSIAKAWIPVLLFGSLAMGQTGGSQPLTCVPENNTPPAIRAEGFSELVGDIILDCRHGTPTPAGQPVPQVNITVTLNTNLTSRLLDSNGDTDVLLLIDQPGTSANPIQLVCNGTCQVTGTGDGTGTYNGSSSHPNIFEATVKTNTVTFLGIPFDPPGSNGTRQLHFMNLRANAAQASSAFGNEPVTATVNIAGGSGGPAQGPFNIVVGMPQQSMVASLIGPPTNTCTATGSGSLPNTAIVNFKEAFPSAWKPRTSTGTAATVQNNPGMSYFSESGLTLPPTAIPPGSPLAPGGFTAGLADYGTRLQAAFSNVPPGAILYVSQTNVGGPSQFQLAASGTGPFSAVNPVPNLLLTYTLPDGSVGASPVYALPVNGGQASAVWEYGGAAPVPGQSANFAVALACPSTIGANALPMTAALGYAPTSFSQSASTTIPGFTTVSYGPNSSGFTVAFPLAPPSLSFTGSFSVSPSSLLASQFAGSPTLATVAATLASNGGQISGLSVTSAPPWVTAAFSSTSTPSELNLYINGPLIGPGSITGSVVVTGTFAAAGAQRNGPVQQAALASTVSVTIPLIVGVGGTAPSISNVQNGASFGTGAVSPGEIATIFGSGIGPPAGASFSVLSSGSVTPDSGGVGVFFNNQYPAAVLYSSSGQVNFVVPEEIANQPSAQVQVVNFAAGTATAPWTVSVAPVSPAVFELTPPPKPQAAVVNQDGTVNSLSNPAAGGTYIQIYATGLGATSPPGQDGGVTSLSPPFPNTASPVTVTIGGQSVVPIYAGSAPGLVNGAYQINTQVPTGLTSPAVLLVTVGGEQSPPVYIGVQ